VWIGRAVDKGTFALVMEDESMSPLFPTGTVLIVNPKQAYKDRSYVVIAFEGKPRVVFRQILIHGDRRYMKCISPDLESLQADPLDAQARICGTLIQARVNYSD